MDREFEIEKDWHSLMVAVRNFKERVFEAKEKGEISREKYEDFYNKAEDFLEFSSMVLREDGAKSENGRREMDIIQTQTQAALLPVMAVIEAMNKPKKGE